MRTRRPHVRLAVAVGVLAAVTATTPVIAAGVGSGPAEAAAQRVAAQRTVAAASPIEQTDGFFVDPSSNPAEWVRQNPRDERASRIEQAIADQPMAKWFGDWPPGEPSEYVRAAEQAGRLPVLVAYNMVNRDCGGASDGGANNPAEYRAWIDAFAAGIGDSPAIVLIEPDALAQADCVDDERLELLRYATGKLGSLPNTWAYLDAGNAAWPGVEPIADRLPRAGLENVRGFVTNVSNFYTTEESVAYANELNAAMGTDVPYAVDTSRNGNGSANGQWCNPSGRALGEQSRVGTDPNGAELLLWVKVPGDSDGNRPPDCDASAPPAGTFSPELAIELIEGAG